MEDRTSYREAMKTVVVSVLSAMAATAAVDAEDGDLPPLETPMMNARIAFNGPYSGDLGLMIEQPLAELLAKRILGFGPEEHLIQDMIDDAVKELLNVICGQFLTLSFGNKPVFSLNIPQIFPLSPQVCNAIVQSSPFLAFRMDGHLLLGNIRVRETDR